uniref:Serpin domain-containing protein n=1 Tax=Megaselia scalaris TaxID=36166 RepID=T1GWU6_MEGSC
MEEPLFSVELYKCIDIKNNLVFSPLSINACLGLAYMGAGGDTAEEFSKRLRFGSLSKEEVATNFFKIFGESKAMRSVQIATKIFINKEFNISDRFSALSKRSFNSSVENMDFSNSSDCEKSINSWVEKETNSKIKNLIAPGTVKAETSALLVNAIYFKGEWEKPFSQSNSTKMPFFSTENKSVEVDFMIHNEPDVHFGDLKDLESSAVELKYKGTDLSMVIVLPDKNEPLTKLAGNIQNNYDLMGISGKLSSRQLDIYIPKLEIETEIDLESPLFKLGIKTAFTDCADFKEMFQGTIKPMKITKAVHKAFIKVDEGGTEAGASTEITITMRSLPRVFKADHPFFWFIKDTNYIYFMGQVTEF